MLPNWSGGGEGKADSRQKVNGMKKKKKTDSEKATLDITEFSICEDRGWGGTMLICCIKEAGLCTIAKGKRWRILNERFAFSTDLSGKCMDDWFERDKARVSAVSQSECCLNPQRRKTVSKIGEIWVR